MVVRGVASRYYVQSGFPSQIVWKLGSFYPHDSFGVNSHSQERSIAIGNPAPITMTTKRTAGFGISKNGKTCVVNWVKNHELRRFRSVKKVVGFTPRALTKRSLR